MKKENPEVINLLAVAQRERKMGNPEIADILESAAETIRERTQLPDRIEELQGILGRIEEAIAKK